MLTYLLSKPADWHLQPSDLEQKCGRDKVYSILKELIDAHYIKRTAVREEKSRRIICYMYTVYEEPYEPLPEKPETAKPETAKPDTANTHITEERDNNRDNVSAPKSKPDRKRDPLFDALANALFGIPVGDNIGKNEAARVAAVKKELTIVDADVTASDINRFVDWYKGCYPNVSVPRDPGKAATHFRQWRGTGIAVMATEGETRFNDGVWQQYKGGSWSTL
jgi:hypothetical protein